MAVYHCSVRVISRGDGRSAVAAAAIRAAETLRDERHGRRYHSPATNPAPAHAEILQATRHAGEPGTPDLTSDGRSIDRPLRAP